MELALPPEVRAVLRAHGLEPAGPLGVGASGLRWSALGQDGRRYAVVHACGDLAAAVTDRAEVLGGLRHPALAHCAHVLPTDDGVVVLVEAEPGTDAAVLLEARGALRPGEVVGLVAPVAEALATLHAAGLAHGDVAPSNVVVTARGPVLVDVLGGADREERGTPAYALRGPTTAPSPAGDVAALGLVAGALLGGTAHRAPDSHPDPDAEGRAAILAACARTAAPVPERPTAAELADELRRACSAAPLEPADPAVLARLGLRRLSGTSEAVDRTTTTQRLGRAGRRPEARHRLPRAPDVPGRRAGDERREERREDRRGVRRGTARRRVRRPVLVGAVVLAGLAGAAVAVALVGVDESATDAAVRLSRERAAALVAGDADALARVTVPGSPAARADERALAAVTGAAGRAGDEPPDWSLDVVPEGAVPCAAAGTCVRVRTLTSYGQEVGEPRSVVLVLAPDPWRVREVRAGG